MYRNVILAGTIWDLDDAVYPELDDYSEMSTWNLYQILKYQLESSSKEMVKTAKKPLVSRNLHGIKVKTCCASCIFKKYASDGRRICTCHHMTVKAKNKCKDWLMDEVMMNAGSRLGKVRDISTKKVILQ